MFLLSLKGIIKVSCFTIACIKYALLSRSISLSVNFFDTELNFNGTLHSQLILSFFFFNFILFLNLT